MMPTRALERLVHAAAWRSARAGPRRRPRPASGDRRGRRLRRARRSARRGRADREPAPGDRAAAPRSPRILPRAAPPTRSRCSPSTGASQRFEDAREARAALVTRMGRGGTRGVPRAQPDARPRPPRRRRAEPDGARESREARGLCSDRAARRSGQRVGDRRSPRLPPKRLRPRRAQRHARDGRRTRPIGEHLDAAAPTTARRVRLPGRLPGPRPPRLRPHRPRLPGATVDRTFVLASPERGGAEWAYVAGIAPAPSTSRSSWSTTMPRRSRRPLRGPGRAPRLSRSPSTWSSRSVAMR